MGILDWLIGSKRTENEFRVPVAINQPQQLPPNEGAERPFEFVMEAEQYWKSDDSQKAEALFRQAIDAYNRYEPSGLDFALGRYGAFLIDQKRLDDASTILEKAVERKTDIPAIWADYLRIAADTRDLERFKRGVELMAVSVRNRVESDHLLFYARRADREGASSFAEAVANYIIERASLEDDRAGRWAAIGDLGRILERADRSDEAVTLWRSAFNEGSTDGETVNRLSMHLERSKEYADAIAVIQDALRRDLPANVDEMLRKRLVRCQEKLGPKRSRGGQKRADVPAYSVRHQSMVFRPSFQVRLKPPIRDLDMMSDVARCLLVSKESSTISDIDLSTGAEIRRVENLPPLLNTWFSPDGAGIGIQQTAAVGNGPTLLRFLDPAGCLATEATVPDAVSEIASGPDIWYVGCRNGLLYGFDFVGKQRWAWETPGSNSYEGSVYFRPCPYYVASQRSFAAVASMGDIYGVAPNGKTLWHAELPNEHQTRWAFTVPFDGDGGVVEAYRTLGLSPGATREEVKSAHRRLALQTHPDRNPSDAEAAAKFRQVQGAYERALARYATDARSIAGITVSIEIQGVGPMASFISANSEGVVVGSSQGRLYRFDAGGRLQEARVLGDSAVRAAIRSDGTAGAAWCNDAVFFLRNDRVVNATDAFSWPRGLTMFGDDVVLWQGNKVHIMDADGRLLWAVEFSKTVTSVATHGDKLICAAGVLTVFERASGRG